MWWTKKRDAVIVELKYADDTRSIPMVVLVKPVDRRAVDFVRAWMIRYKLMTVEELKTD